MNTNSNSNKEKYIIENSKKVEPEDLNKLDKKKRRLGKILNLKIFVDQKEKAKLLLELLKQYRKGNYRSIPWRSISAIVFALLYIVNPLDIIPDVLPFIGYLDDLSVFMALLKLVETDVEAYKEWKLEKNQLSN